MNEYSKTLLVLLIDGFEKLKPDQFTEKTKQLTVDVLRAISNNNLTRKKYLKLLQQMDEISFPSVRFPSGFGEAFGDPHW